MPIEAMLIPRVVIANIRLRPTLSTKYWLKNKKYIPIDIILPAVATIELVILFGTPGKNSPTIKEGIEPG